MLSRSNRLSASPLVMRVLRRGAICHTDLWVLKWIANQLDHPRFAFIVSNKISKRATIRNLIKRRLREAVRIHVLSKVPNADIILIAKASLVNTPYSTISRMIQSELQHCFQSSKHSYEGRKATRTYKNNV